MSQARKAILLMNLGSPDSTSVKDVRTYLNQFLMDKRVIDMPFITRSLLVRGIIVPFRAPKSAEAYKTIWTKEGSPLIVLTQQLRSALSQLVEEPVAIAMRYGHPSPRQAYDELLAAHPQLEEIIAIPLYPHYAMSSFETAVEYAREQYSKGSYKFKLTFIRPFYDDQQYIQALASHMQPWLKQPYDHILFSYHGIPARHVRKTDITGCHCLQANDCCNTPSPAHAYCYRHQVFETTKLVTQQLGIPEDKFSISFQSRLGKGWLEPFTDVRLEQMPAEGIKKLLVICPAFVSDCLETLEEIEERGRASFMSAGGETYHMIPCLNTDPRWVMTIAGWIAEYKAGNERLILNEAVEHRL
ncbi:MAG: ferrochelatase [Chitinophagaceae bacterium]|nr:ferrochelatase [Chitinophagaceae bacterium]